MFGNLHGRGPAAKPSRVSRPEAVRPSTARVGADVGVRASVRPEPWRKNGRALFMDSSVNASSPITQNFDDTDRKVSLSVVSRRRELRIRTMLQSTS
jgi:hypothetical protein